MPQEIKNIGTRDLSHVKAFHYWRTNGQNNTHTADFAEVNVKTVRKWRVDEDWEAHARIDNARDAESLAEASAKATKAHVVDGQAAIETSRTNHKNFQTCIQLLAGVVQQMLKNAKTAGTISTAKELAALIRDSGMADLGGMTYSDARIAALLYPSLIPQRLEIGEIKSPADLMKLDLASLEEFAQVVGEEAEA